MTEAAHDPQTDILALRAKIRELLGDNALAYVDLQMPEGAEDNTARQKHNLRTARYKATKALSLAPDSEAVTQACAYVVFTLLGGRGQSTERMRSWIIDDLVAAGYDRDESNAAIQRLKRNARDRKAFWQKRTRQRLARQVLKALSDAERSDLHTR